MFKYFCFKNIFKELVLERERQTRMPSDKEIDQIVEEKGSWCSDEIDIIHIKNVLKKFKKENQCISIKLLKLTIIN